MTDRKAPKAIPPLITKTKEFSMIPPPVADVEKPTPTPPPPAKAGEAPIRGWGALQDIGVFGPSPVAIVRGFITDLDRILRQAVRAQRVYTQEELVVAARLAIIDLFSRNAIFADERFVVQRDLIAGIVNLNKGDIVVIKRAKTP